MKTKRKAADIRLRNALSKNVKRRMSARYASERSESAQIRALATESGVGRSTIQRVLDYETYGLHRTTLDVVAKLAMALRCEAWELLKDGTEDDAA